MNGMVKTPPEITFEQVYALAQQLRLADQMRLIARLAPKMASFVEQVERIPPQPRAGKPLRGLLKDLGPAPSASEIDEVQREMWANFVQADL